MGYDQTKTNRIKTLETEAEQKQAAYRVSKALTDALTDRVARFEAELSAAQGDLATANSNYAAALKTANSVRGAMAAAIDSARGAMMTYAYVRKVFQISNKAAREAVQAGHDVSALLSEVDSASKNSLITPLLRTKAEEADGTAATAVAAATTALRDAMTAFVAAERSVWASFLVMASIINLQRLASGYQRVLDSDELGVPDALFSVPQPALGRLDDTDNPAEPAELTDKLNTSLMNKYERARLMERVEAVLVEWLQAYITQALSRKKGKNKPGKTVAGLLEQLFPEDFAPGRTRPGQEPPPNPNDADMKPGLTDLFREIQAGASTYEEEIDAATTNAKVALSHAQQELARRQADSDAVQKALTAARQAA